MLNSQTCFSHKKTILLSLLALFSLSGCGPLFTTDHWEQTTKVCAADSTPVTFKKVGYWSEDHTDNFKDVNYQALTHLIYGHVPPNADASLPDFADDEDHDFKDIIDLAKAENVKVLISIGGPDVGTSNFKTIASSTALTKQFANNVVDFIEDYGLDGVDLNWQTPADNDEGELFEKVVKKLSETLSGKGYLVTISVISGVEDDERLAEVIDDTVFDYVDFVNVRAFDTTNDDDLHASEQDAIDAIAYWRDRCLIRNKLVLGIPFYSRGASVDSYADIVDQKHVYACRDESLERNYNGIATVIKKTNYALNHAGGVMMKSLEQDTYKANDLDYSLLHAINETVLGHDVTICD